MLKVRGVSKSGRKITKYMRLKQIFHPNGTLIRAGQPTGDAFK